MSDRPLSSENKTTSNGKHVTIFNLPKRLNEEQARHWKNYALWTLIIGVGLLLAVDGFLAIAWFLGMVPANVAYRRGHVSRHAILALTVMLGWTVIGWIAALVWALSGQHYDPTAVPAPQSPSQPKVNITALEY